LSQDQGELRTQYVESTVSILGCLYLAVAITYYSLKFSSAPGGIPISLYGVIPFVVVFLLAAVGVRLKPRAGYVTAIAISAVTILLLGPNLNLAEELSLEGVLTGGATFIGVLFITLFFALFGARAAWSKSRPAGAFNFRLGRKAGIGALAFLVLFMALGVAYGATQVTSVTNTGQANVVIAPGAGYITSHNFYLPSTLQVKVGQTVTWKNLDNVPHTVTSDTGLFHSGNLDPNAVYSFTFAQPGTYYYSCDYHAWMTGAIVVTS
jgi:plastocyanin